MTANDRNMKITPEIALKELLESSNEVAIFFLATLNISVDLNSKKTTASDKKV